jgi:hypothetical protein
LLIEVFLVTDIRTSRSGDSLISNWVELFAQFQFAFGGTIDNVHIMEVSNVLMQILAYFVGVDVIVADQADDIKLILI